VLTIRRTKFFKSRLVPLGRDLSRTLQEYRCHRDGRHPDGPTTPFFCFRNGQRVTIPALERTFRRLRVAAGIRRDGGPRRQPRLHDLRHAAAVHRVIQWYRQGRDVQRLLPHLATYLGHVDLSSTQRYLTLTPSLLHEASVRFERYAMEHDHA
jgi:site-specific recombinase XerD